MCLPLLALAAPPDRPAYAAPTPLDPACKNDANSEACKNSTCNKAPNSPVCTGAASNSGENPVVELLSKAANLIALVAGVGAVIMIVIGAFFLVTSGGNTDAITKARSRITSGVIGIAIVALAWLIIRFVIDKLVQ